MKICPICTLVAGSWIGLLAYRALGGAVDPSLIATLMGASAVGVTIKRSPTFKLLVIPPLVAVAYGAATERWALAGVMAVLGASVAGALLIRDTHPSSKVVSEAEHKLEQCC